MFGIGLPEMLLILAIALIIIGPKKLPDMAKSLGRALGEFKKATSDLKESVGLNEDFRDVKKTFQDMNQDVKDSILAASTDTEKTPPTGQRPAQPPPAPDDTASDDIKKSPSDTPSEPPQAEDSKGENDIDGSSDSTPESGK